MCRGTCLTLRVVALLLAAGLNARVLAEDAGTEETKEKKAADEAEPPPATPVDAETRRKRDLKIRDTPPALATEGPRPASVAPLDPAALEASIARGVAFLLERQNKDGWWGSARETKDLNIYAPAPGAHDAFRAAVTGLAVWALCDGADYRADKRVHKALERAEKWMGEHLPKLRRATPDALYNVWGHAFAIEGLVRLHGLDLEKEARKNAERRAKIAQLIDQQIELLGRYESVDGGWGYYDFNTRSMKPGSSPSSFTTATVLVALKDAQGIGRAVPQKLIDRATYSIRRQRNADYTYLYGEYLKKWPVWDINRPAGSLGRSQVCNLALRRWGDASCNDAVLKTWLDRLFARNEWLSVGRKRPVPHESFFAIAGYFYYFGHLYAGLSIDELPAGERSHFRDQLAHVLMPLQEKDGCWWDYPFYDYHFDYGTAMALVSLSHCRTPAPAAPAGAAKK